MIRRARAGNTNPTISTYDRKAQSWISGADQERKAAAAKVNLVNNTTDLTEKPRNGNNHHNNGDADSSKSGDDSGAEDSSNEYPKSADEDEFDGDETTPFKPSSSNKRRKVASRHNGGQDDTRTFEIRKWMPIPPTQTTVDRTFLAPRRPGMPALYNNPEYAQKIFGQYHSSASLTGTSGYDLGEGGGLSNASGVLSAGTNNDTGVATPRKNIPPRRKKKKLGGPGRKKANPNPVVGDENGSQISAANGVAGQGVGIGDGAMEGVTGDGADDENVNTSGNATRNPGYDGTQDDAAAHDDDNDNDNESGSEAEGSEEGEIDETSGTGIASGSGSAHATENPPTIEVTAAPETVLAPVAAPEPTPIASVHTEVTVPSTSAVFTDTEPKPIDEAQDVAPASPLPAPVTASVEVPDPVTDTDIDTTTTILAEPAEPVVESTIEQTNTTIPPTTTTTTGDASPSPVPIANPTVTITDTDTAMADPTTAIDTLMPDALLTSKSKDPEETAIIEENAAAITGDGAAMTAEETATETMTEKVKSQEDVDDAGASGDGEIDLLGGLDEAIDRGMSEGA